MSLCPALNALGLLYKHTKDLTRAEQCLAQALQLRLEWSSPHHPETMAIRHNLGEVLIVSGRAEEGKELLRENVRLMEEKRKGQG